MDLVVGSVSKGLSCIFAVDYNAAIRSKRNFTSATGDEIQILAVFMGKGSTIDTVRNSMQIKSTIVAWFAASPGQVTDEVHSILNPNSVANTHSRSMDANLRPVELQSNVSEREAKKPGAGRTSHATSPADSKLAKPRDRRKTPLHCE